MFNHYATIQCKNLGGSSELKEQFSDQILLGNNDSQTVQNLYGTNELPNFQMEKEMVSWKMIAI